MAPIPALDVVVTDGGSGFKLDPCVYMHELMGFHDYSCLQMNAFAMVSDSGTLPEESSFFASHLSAVRSRRRASARPPSAPRSWTRRASRSPASPRGTCSRPSTPLSSSTLRGLCLRRSCSTTPTRPCPPRWSRSSRATRASWIRWCGGSTREFSALLDSK